MADILNVLPYASKLAFLAFLGRKDSFELPTHELGQKGLLRYAS